MKTASLQSLCLTHTQTKLQMYGFYISSKPDIRLNNDAESMSL